MIPWLRSLGSPGWGIAATLALLLAGGFLGATCLRLAGQRLLRHPVDAMLVATVLGLDIVALAVLLIGVIVVPSKAACLAIVAPMAAAGAAWLLRSLRKSASLRRRLSRPVAVIAVIAIAVPALGAAGCWPYGWDELTYHVEVPMRWIAAGHVSVLPDNPYSAFPSAVELLFTLLLRMAGVTAPRALCVAAWLLCGACAYRLLRPQVRRSIALALAFAFAWTPVFLMVASETYVEGFLVLQLAALLLVARGGPWTTRRAILMGALAGFAAAVKLIGTVMGPVILAAEARWHASRPLHPWLRPMILAGVVAVVVAAPFYSRALFATGNPIHPFHARLLVPSDAAALATSEYHHDLTSRRYGERGAAAILLTPFQLTTQGDRYSGRFGWQWPILLALGLLSLRVRRGRSLMAAALVLYMAWLLTAPQSRFLLPALLLVTLAAAVGLARLPRSPRLAACALLVVATILSVGKDRWMHFWSTWQAAIGIGAAPSPEDFIFTGTGDAHLLAMKAIFEKTPPDARVLLLFDPRGLYVPRAHEVGTPLFQALRFTPPEAIGDADAVLATLRGGGFTHVLVGAPTRNPDLLPDHQARGQLLLDALARLEERGDLRVTWQQQGFELIEIEP